MCTLHVRLYDCREHHAQPNWVTRCAVALSGRDCGNSSEALAGQTGRGGMILDDSRALGNCPIHGPWNPHDQCMCFQIKYLSAEHVFQFSGFLFILTLILILIFLPQKQPMLREEYYQDVPASPKLCDERKGTRRTYLSPIAKNRETSKYAGACAWRNYGSYMANKNIFLSSSTGSGFSCGVRAMLRRAQSEPSKRLPGAVKVDIQRSFKY